LGTHPFGCKTERNEKNHYTRYTASGHWHGEIRIEIEEQAPQVVDIAPFDNPEKALQHLTGPLIGFYGPTGKTRRFEVRQPEIQPCLGKVLKVSFPFLVDLGLLKEKEMKKPHNILLAQHGRFHVFLPPRPL